MCRVRPAKSMIFIMHTVSFGWNRIVDLDLVVSEYAYVCSCNFSDLSTTVYHVSYPASYCISATRCNCSERNEHTLAIGASNL